MSIPDYQTFMLPFLKLAADGKEHSLKDAYNTLSEQFGLTEEEKKILLPSGLQSVVNNRIGWAKTYLKKSKLIEYPRRGNFKITGRGLEILKTNPTQINRGCEINCVNGHRYVNLIWKKDLLWPTQKKNASDRNN